MKLQFRARASALGDLMTGINHKAEGAVSPLPETAKKAVYKQFCADHLGAKEVINSNPMTKGKMVEEANISLFHEVTGYYLEKNEKRFESEFLTGTPDGFFKNKEGARVVVDFKSSYTRLTYLNGAEPPVRPRSIGKYGWQLIAYMLLTDTDHAELCYGFVSTPESIVNDELRRLWYQMRMDDEGGDPREWEARQKEYDEAEKNIRLMHSAEGWAPAQRVQRYALVLSDPDKWEGVIQARIIAANEFYLTLTEKWKSNKGEYLDTYSI